MRRDTLYRSFSGKVDPSLSRVLKLLGALNIRLVATPLGREAGKSQSRRVWVYVDASKLVGDKDHLNVFGSEDVAKAWFEQNDPEGVAFEYPVMKAAS